MSAMFSGDKNNGGGDVITYLRLKDTIGGTHGTFGIFLDDNIPFATGLEPIQPIVSPGDYKVSWYFSPKRKKYVYLLQSVPGHEGVEIHTGNQVHDTQGCILIGQGYGKSQIKHTMEDGIIDSRLAFFILEAKVGTTNPWVLKVSEV